MIIILINIQTIAAMPTFRLAPTPIALAVFVLTSSVAQAQTPAAGDAQTMPSVVVSASADASAEGLSRAYAGGQVARGGRIDRKSTRLNSSHWE